MTLIEELNDILEDYSIEDLKIFEKPINYALSSKKIANYKRIGEIQRYYQCNPVQFIDDFFGIELFDAQAYVITMAWNCPNVLILASRALGKTTLGDLFLMAKSMLFNNWQCYIASGSGSQSQNTFSVIEKLANDGIDTMVGSTGYIFKQELEVPNANGDGFSHSADGWRYRLYNASSVTTLNSNVDKMFSCPL